jgi:hypothetical protein
MVKKEAEKILNYKDVRNKAHVECENIGDTNNVLGLTRNISESAENT